MLINLKKGNKTMIKQCASSEVKISSSDLYLVSGRVCDCENEFQLVSANSAEDIFEQYVRMQVNIEGSDFYIEHCQKISDMHRNVLTKS